ncbi:hypothetical protein EYF80_035086 [Liparis tanakae]|uniref:Uncharacterized protein n=1 Tax=Liparis tanakae TaxID=230148 RepID=A0A4Z2GPD7_9TELE|nr:hypothetical protein EYF80_035086 [Liparis tanakae]
MNLTSSVVRGDQCDRSENTLQLSNPFPPEVSSSSEAKTEKQNKTLHIENVPNDTISRTSAARDNVLIAGQAGMNVHLPHGSSALTAHSLGTSYQSQF